MTGHTITVQPLDASCREAVATLFTAVFTASAGEAEGQLVGELAAELAGLIDDQNVIAYGALQDGELVGAVVFSRLRFGHTPLIHMLSPLAVRTDRQRQGIGRRLIQHSLKELRQRSVKAVITYGDPGFYGPMGFEPIPPGSILPPYPLSQPQGWLGCSLSGAPLPTLPGRPSCVEPFRDPGYW